MDRIRDKSLMKLMASQSCCIKGCRTKFNQVSGHHIRSRGAFGPDLIENLIPLCFNCHTKIHAYDIEKAFRELRGLEDVLKRKGWEVLEVGEGSNKVLKLRHPEISSA